MSLPTSYITESSHRHSKRLLAWLGGILYDDERISINGVLPLVLVAAVALRSGWVTARRMWRGVPRDLRHEIAQGTLDARSARLV